MRRRIILALTFAFAVGVATFLLPVTSPKVLAQQSCKDFRAMYHMTLMVNINTGEGGWNLDVADPIVALLNGQAVTPTVEFLGGGTSFATGMVGHDRGGTNVWHLSNGDDFTVGAWHAIYPNQPANTWGGGSAGQYVYNGTGKIVAGTGQLANATGAFSETGPYIVWVDLASDPPMVYGKYQALLVASVCSK
jgi:hypothetical protein